MNSSKRPVTIILVACLYLAVGTLGLIFHFPELLDRRRGSILVESVELLAIVCGAFMLRGRNWARWLAVLWMGFHVILSLYSIRDLVVHSLLFALITWLLFRKDAVRYFSGTVPANPHV